VNPTLNYSSFSESNINTPVQTAEDIVRLYGEPQWGPNGKTVYERTYSRIKEDGENEIWADTVLRVVDGNLAYIDGGVSGEREYLIENIYKFNIIPAGRHLWSTGAAGVNATANCFVAPWTDKLSYHFCWVFDHLMTGSGVGANYTMSIMNEFNPVQPLGRIEIDIMCKTTHQDYKEINPDLDENSDPVIGNRYVKVKDSREGWVWALKEVIDMAVKPSSHDPKIIIDVSEVRPRNSPIRGFGGTASGPGPLADLLRSAVNVLNRSAIRGHLTPIEAMELDHEIARCVVAGNVRRSARMSVLNWNDPYIDEFLKCKSEEDPTKQKHWTTNISVGVDDDFIKDMHNDRTIAGKIHQQVVEGMIHNGEPGYLNLSLANAEIDSDGVRVWATNPCGEQFLEQGAACSLAHVNLANIANLDHDDKMTAFAAMARFAIRSLNRDFLDEVEQFATEEYRRIGVGFFGLQEFAATLGVKYSEIADSSTLANFFQEAYRAVRNEADRYCDSLGWNRPKQVTTVAPTGSIATLAGKSTGCEPIIYRYFNRLVRFGTDDTRLQNHIDSGLYVEPCVASPNSTQIVYFPTRDPILDLVPEDLVEESVDINLEDHMKVQEFIQTNYVDNSISKTIQADENINRKELSDLLIDYLPKLKGVTVFTNNENFVQAPFQRITKEEYFAASLENQTIGDIEAECTNGSCPIK